MTWVAEEGLRDRAQRNVEDEPERELKIDREDESEVQSLVATGGPSAKGADEQCDDEREHDPAEQRVDRGIAGTMGYMTEAAN